jgi:hypothetical protein
MATVRLLFKKNYFFSGNWGVASGAGTGEAKPAWFIWSLFFPSKKAACGKIFKGFGRQSGGERGF